MIFYWKLFWAQSLDDIIDISNIYVFHGALEKIIEVTYSYREIEDGYLLNETLFEEYLWLTYPEKDIEFLWRKYIYKIQVQIALIDEILVKVNKIKVASRIASLRRGIFIDSLEYVKNILEISVLWADFEMEKAGYIHRLTSTKIRKKISEIEKREKLAFGWKVIENSEEFSFCYNFVNKNHNLKKKHILQKDVTSMNRYLKIIKENTSCEIIETPHTIKKSIKGSFLKKRLARQDYRKIFDSVCEFYDLPQRTKLTNAGSIYDGDNFLEIPRDESFSCLDIERILKLLTHEIESHYINTYNGKILLWNFRGSKNLPKEEWLAMFMERIFHWYTYENMDNIVESFFTIMAGECIDGDEFEDFMRIMGKEYKCKPSYKNSAIRAKRNYPFNHVWVQHKDTVYFRGLTQLAEYLKRWGQFRKLFLGKVGFHDIENLFDIYQKHPEREKVVFPIFISDLIYYYLLEKEKNKEFVFSTVVYYVHLKKKYWFLGLDSFNIVEQINTKWKKIEKIITLFEKAK